jgi:hypothetical protein
MRFQWGSTSIRLGKPPYARAEDRDILSRLALAYGVRRDMHEVAKAVRVRVDLPSDRGTDQAIRQVISAVIATAADSGISPLWMIEIPQLIAGVGCC